MKKLLITGMIVLFSYTYSFAFIGAIINAASKLFDDVSDATYKKVMMMKTIQQAKTLIGNYKASKKFYADMKRLQKHRGGIPGYMSDRISSDIERRGQSLYWRFQDDIQRAPDDRRYIEDFIKAGEEGILKGGDAVTNKVLIAMRLKEDKQKADYLEQLVKVEIEAQKERDKKFDQLAEKYKLLKRGRDDDGKKLSDDEIAQKRIEYDDERAMIDTENQSAANALAAAQLKLEVEKKQRKVKEEEDEIVQRMRFYESVKRMYEASKKSKPGKSPFIVLEETPSVWRD